MLESAPTSQAAVAKMFKLVTSKFVIGSTLLGLLLSGVGNAQAFQPDRVYQRATPATNAGSIETAFTPEQDAAGLIISAVNKARRQILVQAFSFTHRGIAQALIAAHHRGVDVRLIADREQTEKIERGQIPAIAAAGVPVWLDGEHQSAHNKVMVIDADSSNNADVAVITGSYNFTNAAQYKNAENLLLIRANRPLAEAYRTNWQRHLAHAKPYTR